jgi:hypothetical protein
LEAPVASSHYLNQYLIAMPGVVQDSNDQIHVSGARSDETEVVLDGFEINDPATNTYDSRLNVDIRQATVQSGRYGAEYADAGASVTSAQALQTQLWTALIAILLVKFLQLKSAFGWSLSNLVA